MNFEDFRKDVLRTVNPDLDHEKRINHGFTMLGSESGEVLGILQKTYQGKPLNLEMLEDELGDVLYALFYIASECNISIDAIMETNVAKRLIRFPVKFDAKRADWRAQAEPMKGFMD